jgi:hypothetical protein
MFEDFSQSLSLTWEIATEDGNTVVTMDRDATDYDS